MLTLCEMIQRLFDLIVSDYRYNPLDNTGQIFSQNGFSHTTQCNSKSMNKTPIHNTPRPIRLLQLAPGIGRDDVACSITLSDLREEPRYEALSYAWGDLKDRVQLHCCGRKLSVTKNLYSALSHLRYKDRPRLL
jgi:hypothetical protein